MKLSAKRVHPPGTRRRDAVGEQADGPVHHGEEEGRRDHVERALQRRGKAGAAREEGSG
jgi:hypothetical protein